MKSPLPSFPSPAVLSFLLAALPLPFAGCGGDQPDGPPERNQTVMVIDDGIDTSLPVFRGKVLGAYTIECTGGMGRSDSPMGSIVMDMMASPRTADFETKKAARIEHLRTPDDECRLKEGISAKRDPLAGIARYRDRWNQAVLRKERGAFSAQEGAELMAAFERVDEDLPVHGSATAGVVAYDAPAVKLVLVEHTLGTEASFMKELRCLDPGEIADEAKLLADPDVRQAYSTRPQGRLDRELDALVARFGIGVVNESFGTPATAVIEEVLRKKGCPEVDLRAVFTRAQELDAAMTAARPPAVLFVKAAGNEGRQIDTAADQEGCQPGAPSTLMVGSYAGSGRRSAFSNFGACVDLYAPGEHVLAPIPGNWLLPLSGTSFSAPLTTRLVAERPRSPFTPAAVRAQILAMRDGAQRLPSDRFPAALLFPGEDEPSQRALRAGGAERAGAPAAEGAPPRKSSLEGVTGALARARRFLQR